MKKVKVQHKLTIYTPERFKAFSMLLLYAEVEVIEVSVEEGLR